MKSFTGTQAELATKLQQAVYETDGYAVRLDGLRTEIFNLRDGSPSAKALAAASLASYGLKGRKNVE